MSKPTKDDASLLLQIIAITNADERYRKATQWFFGEFDVKTYDEFKAKYPKGSKVYKNFQSFASYGELIGTLVNKEIISEDLVFDLWGPLFWNKVEPIAHGMRKEVGMPRLYENYEVCAKKYPAWDEKNPPKV